ncbi:hypothetical protein KY362_07450 [Candidatus Woesearchaeota archaeon]|nr:hypothetical protein [Candidatus Woesearchaeota archaeon]
MGLLTIIAMTYALAADPAADRLTRKNSDEGDIALNNAPNVGRPVDTHYPALPGRMMQDQEYDIERPLNPDSIYVDPLPLEPVEDEPLPPATPAPGQGPYRAAEKASDLPANFDELMEENERRMSEHEQEIAEEGKFNHYIIRGSFVLDESDTYQIQPGQRLFVGSFYHLSAAYMCAPHQEDYHDTKTDSIMGYEED